MMSLAPVFASLGRAGKKKKTLKIHKKSRFQPKEKNFAESCSMRCKDLLRAKKFFGVIGTLNVTIHTLRNVYMIRCSVIGRVIQSPTDFSLLQRVLQ